MRHLIILLLTSASLLIACGDGNTSFKGQSRTKAEFDKNITTKDLIALFNNIDNEDYLTSKLDSHDFRKKFNGVYISNESVAANEPKHWIHVSNMGALSSVSISTADQENWERLLKELESFSEPEPFEDGTSDITKRYIGQDYIFESYEPMNGINLSLNDLYQVFVFKNKKEEK